MELAATANNDVLESKTPNIKISDLHNDYSPSLSLFSSMDHVCDYQSF